MSISSTTTTDSLYNEYSERTLAIVKPEAYEDAKDIEQAIRDNGFKILARRKLRLTPEQAAEFYRGHYGQHYYPHLAAHMSSGPILVMVLAANNCIQRWRVLMGPARVAEAQAYWPECLRAGYGRRTDYGDYFNGLHGSTNHSDALREIHFFFPNMIVGPLLRRFQVQDYILKNISPTLVPALTKLADLKLSEPIIWLANELLHRNPNEPQIVGKPVDEAEKARCNNSEAQLQ